MSAELTFLRAWLVQATKRIDRLASLVERNPGSVPDGTREKVRASFADHDRRLANVPAHLALAARSELVAYAESRQRYIGVLAIEVN